MSPWRQLPHQRTQLPSLPSLLLLLTPCTLICQMSSNLPQCSWIMLVHPIKPPKLLPKYARHFLYNRSRQSHLETNSKLCGPKSVKLLFRCLRRPVPCHRWMRSKQVHPTYIIPNQPPPANLCLSLVVGRGLEDLEVMNRESALHRYHHLRLRSPVGLQKPRRPNRVMKFR